MSTLIIDRVQQKEKLTSIMGAISHVSACEEPSEHRINRFLDHINDSKSFLKRHGITISNILLGLDEIAWFRDIDDETKKLVEDLVNTMEVLSKEMIRHYADVNTEFTKQGIDKTELKFYKGVACELKERAVDLRDIFLVLPLDQEFQDLCEELNDL